MKLQVLSAKVKPQNQVKKLEHRPVIMFWGLIVCYFLVLLLVNLNDASVHRRYENIANNPVLGSNKDFRRIEAAYGHRYLISNVNMISMVPGSEIQKVSILVEEGVITRIGDLRAVSIPEGTIKLQCDSLYAIPGLADMHVHAYEIQSLEKFLSYGVTIVRNMSGSEVQLQRRENIKIGKLLGPEMLVSTPIIDGPNPTWPHDSIVLEHVDDVYPVIKSSVEAGYDFVKIYDNLSREIFDEVMRISKKEGIPAAGHIPQAVSLEHASRMGLWSSEHLFRHGLEYQNTQLLKHSIEALVGTGMYICPTPYIYKRGLNADVNGISFEEVKRYMFALKEAGALVVSGTDEASTTVPAGISLHQTLQIMVEAGFTPYEALQTSTINAAEMLGTANRLGTIEVGKDADILFLNTNPLENIQNTLDIAGLMTKGRWLDLDWILNNR